MEVTEHGAYRDSRSDKVASQGFAELTIQA